MRIYNVQQMKTFSEKVSRESVWLWSQLAPKIAEERWLQEKISQGRTEMEQTV